MEWKPFNYETRIRETHLDSFGHVNNAAYLVLFEEARWEMITEAGYGLPKVHATKQGPVILEANLKFKRELKNREKIRIENKGLGYEGKIGRLSQILYNSNGEVACEAVFVFGFFDLKERKLIPPTMDWLHAIGAPR